MKSDISVDADTEQMSMSMNVEAQESAADELLAMSVTGNVTLNSEKSTSVETEIYLAREDSDYRIYLRPPAGHSSWSQALATEEQLTKAAEQYLSQQTTIESYMEHPVQLGVRAEGDSYIIEAQPSEATIKKILASQPQSAGLEVKKVNYALVSWTVNQQTYHTEATSVDLRGEFEARDEKMTFTVTGESSFSYDPVSLSLPDQARSAPEVDFSELDF